jgi:hypothetical protein
MHISYTRAYILEALYLGETLFKTCEFFVGASVFEISICTKCHVKNSKIQFFQKHVVIQDPLENRHIKSSIA